MPQSDSAPSGRGEGSLEACALMLIGDRDTRRDLVVRLHADLTAGGVDAELNVAPGIGH